MVEIIVGEKGTGKTKHMLERVNQEIKTVQGTLVYIDKSPKYMYQLDSRVRMINMPDYPINDTDELIGFLCGVISQNNSIEKIFIDSFLTLAYIDTSEGLRLAIDKLSVISKTFEFCPQHFTKRGKIAGRIKCKDLFITLDKGIKKGVRYMRTPFYMIKV